jgi:tRNA(fMet)-specific endonuclease VapC
VAAELRYGCAKRPGTRLAARVEAFLDELPVIAFDRSAERAYGTIRAGLEGAGQTIGGNDLLIAAHALSLGTTIVTANVREFGRVAGLAVENWAEGGTAPATT